MSDRTDSALPADPLAWLSGSEMGQLIAAMDWTRLPLGPMADWPASLRTAVSICLDSRHPIVLWWGAERTMFYNDAYRPMLGESKHPQFMGGSGQACWAEIWDIIGPMMDQVIATGRATWSEDMFLLMRRSGYLEETYFTFSYSPIRDEQGRPCGIFNACSESTGRVLSQRRLKMLREMAVEARSAEEAAGQCAGILGHNPQDIPFALIYLADAAGRQLRLAGRTGLAADTPASPLVVDLADGADGGWPLAGVFRQGSGQRVDDLAARFAELPSTPWGEPPHQAVLLPISRPGRPQPAGVVVLAISPRRVFDDDYRGFFELAAGHVATAVANARAYEEERQSAEALAEIDRAKTVFFSNVSHEFRTPLTLMLGPLEESLAAAQLAGADRERIELAHRNARRLQKLVNALLDFSRIEAGRLQARFEPTELAAYTAELASVFRSAIDKAGLALRVDCPPLPEAIFVDREMWEKIILNLLSNAFKHTFAGSISVTLRAGGDHVECTVADTGVGIPAAELPHIFERFRRVHGARSRTQEGTGIGLALVRELVRLHGGTVAVESQEGLGTRFTVSLPTGSRHLPPEQLGSGASASNAATYAGEAMLWLANEAGEAAAPPFAETLPAAPETPGQGGRPRVLWVDDNADMRDYVRRLLAGRYEVTALADGAKAVSCALILPPDLVLADVMMPGLDGFGVLRALRADERTRTVPVILLSARAGEAARVEGLAAGADDYLVKPFSARELLARVDGALRLAQVRREANQKLSRYVAELEGANQELSSFAYSVSHDLRAPLRAIIGFSQALIEDFDDQLPAGARDFLDEISRAGLRMGALIDGILALSRCTRGELQWGPVDLSAIAEHIRKVLTQSDPARHVTWRIEAGLGADGDARMLEAVLENLLGNAWKYTAHVAAPEIRLFAQRSEGERRFCVADNGAGFDMEHADKLFKPFQRLHREDEFPGIGVGLATVQRIIHRHGGSIEASAAPGQGATFTFTLPASGANGESTP